MHALRLGLASSLSRLASRGVVVGVLLVVALAITAGAIEAGSPDRTLYLVHRFLVPLGVALVVGAAARGDLRRGTWAVARFGASRAAVAAGQVSAMVIASVGLALAATWIALVFGHGLAGGLAGDALTSSWIAVLSALAYVALFGLASTIGRGASALGVVFFADFFLGGSGLFGALLPRGHVANLLGFAAPLGLSQRTSSAALLGMTVVFGALLLFRARDR